MGSTLEACVQQSLNGVWAGTTERQRKRLRRRAAQRPASSARSAQLPPRRAPDWAAVHQRLAAAPRVP